ncbi:hypothetical protein [Streptomyces sp. NPDC127098]|uniref:hypothetical protein n=1 Tax=Streptomyces sp. NPDC127098 TaxID=3347137 RepID=UPI00364E9DFE
MSASGSSDDGINDPLPRMSREEAEEWTAHWAESMARSGEAELDLETVRSNFLDCVGDNDEVADDGRFTHSYSVQARIEPERDAEAIRAIRDALEQNGLRIQGYRSDPSVSPANLVDAWHPEDHQSVTAEDHEEGRLLFIIRTPCLLPPGVEQQQFG